MKALTLFALAAPFVLVSTALAQDAGAPPKKGGLSPGAQKAADIMLAPAPSATPPPAATPPGPTTPSTPPAASTPSTPPASPKSTDAPTASPPTPATETTSDLPPAVASPTLSTREETAPPMPVTVRASDPYLRTRGVVMLILGLGALGTGAGLSVDWLEGKRDNPDDLGLAFAAGGVPLIIYGLVAIGTGGSSLTKHQVPEGTSPSVKASVLRAVTTGRF